MLTKHVRPAALLTLLLCLTINHPCFGQANAGGGAPRVEIRNLKSWTEYQGELTIHWTSWQEVRSVSGLLTPRIAAVVSYADRAAAQRRLRELDPRNSHTTYHAHHGVQSAWMRSRFSRYDARNAPSIMVPPHRHLRGHGLGSSLLPHSGRQINWSQVTPRQIRDISQKMFDSLGLPGRVRIQYWREFHRYMNSLSWHGRLDFAGIA